MGFIVGLLLGALIGLGLYCIYSWLTDKINILKLGYTGGSKFVKWIYNRFIKK